MPHILQKLQGLTYLGLSYSFLSNELIMVLCQSHRGGGRNSGRNGNMLHTLSLTCMQREPHHQLVCCHSWATLVSSCLDLKVHISVEQVINTDSLAKILLPEIPLREFNMTAFYSSDETWSVKPLLCHMLLSYRHSREYLTLDVSNCIEPMDDELLEMLTMCEHLVDLRVWAFLDVLTVRSLLHMRLTQNFSLNKIKVRIYSLSDNVTVQERQLNHKLSAYEKHFPPEVQVLASVMPLI